MKKILKTSMSVIALFIIVSTLQSCITDCDKYCKHGYCISGDCECDPGYEGMFCDVYTGNTGNTGNTGGTNTGEVTFYTASDLGCGNISVTVSGYSTKYITSFYSNGINNCGESGCATYTLDPGTYYYTAVCSGYSWSSTSFTITSNGCLQYELY